MHSVYFKLCTSLDLYYGQFACQYYFRVVIYDHRAFIKLVTVACESILDLKYDCSVILHEPYFVVNMGLGACRTVEK